jgi:hypothetical protein
MTHLRKVAREICRAVTDDCLMDTDPDRPKCTDDNCRMIPIARRALEEAAASGPRRAATVTVGMSENGIG